MGVGLHESSTCAGQLVAKFTRIRWGEYTQSSRSAYIVRDSDFSATPQIGIPWLGSGKDGALVCGVVRVRVGRCIHGYGVARDVLAILADRVVSVSFMERRFGSRVRDLVGCGDGIVDRDGVVGQGLGCKHGDAEWGQKNVSVCSGTV